MGNGSSLMNYTAAGPDGRCAEWKIRPKSEIDRRERTPDLTPLERDGNGGNYPMNF